MLKQLLVLCISNVVVYSSIGGLVGLMPVHLSRLGADATAIGAVLATAYLALALSNVVTGRLCQHHLTPRGWLALGGLIAAPTTYLLGRAVTVGQVWMVMPGVWFAIGMPMTVASVLTGLAADSVSRGRRFGVLTLSSGLGLALGSLISGRIVDRWGFAGLFYAFAALFLVLPLAGWFVEGELVREASPATTPDLVGPLRNRTFALLFTATILAQAANITIFLSRPLLMDALHYDASAISGAAAVGSAVTLPLPLLIGWLADRVGRKQLVLACFAGPVVGLLLQAAATQPWQFAGSAVLSTVVGVSIVVESAMVADLFPSALLGRALGLLNSTAWIGIVLGLSAGGLAIHALRIPLALLLSAAVGCAGILLLTRVPEPKTESASLVPLDDERAA